MQRSREPYSDLDEVTQAEKAASNYDTMREAVLEGLGLPLNDPRGDYALAAVAEVLRENLNVDSQNVARLLEFFTPPPKSEPSKSPEQLAQEYANLHPYDIERISVKYSAFLAGYRAAQTEANK